jgi:glucokinase-like ROK family protein
MLFFVKNNIVFHRLRGMDVMVTTADQNLVRKFNTSVVLNMLRHSAPLSRAEVATQTGLNRSTVSSIINELLANGLVQETILQSDRIGRPGMLLELNPVGAFAVGVELGVDFILVALVDFMANIHWRKQVESDPADGQQLVLDRVYALIREALAESTRLGLCVRGIGLGVPGLVDQAHGEVKLAPNLGWSDVPLRQLLMEQFALPVYVENEANAAALGEFYFGVGREHHDFLYLNAGVGMGAGIIIDDKLFRGSCGYAAEVGHMIIDPQGDLCGCGKRGCWETRVGPRAVVRRFQYLLRQGVHSTVMETTGNCPSRVTFQIVADAARQSDPAALEAMHEVALDLGLGIANLVNIFNPEMVVLGGALAYASEILLPDVEKTVHAYALSLPCKPLRIVASAHYTDGSVVGAAALVLDNIFSEPNF